jgi:hypothetical protein
MNETLLMPEVTRVQQKAKAPWVSRLRFALEAWGSGELPRRFWTDANLTLLFAGGMQVGALSVERVCQNFRMMADFFGPVRAEPERVSASQLMGLLRWMGLPMTEHAPAWMPAALDYINGAPRAAGVRARLMLTLDVLEVLASGSTCR